MAQGWKKAFERLFWKNRPSTDTPLNATDMNHIESGIDALDDRIVQLDVLKADAQVVNGMVADVLLNESNGVLTITYKNGSTKVYDTNLEKIAINFTYDYSTQRLVLTLSDGTTQYVDMSALITQYEFKDSTTIAFSVDSTGKVSASVKNGSITESMLETGYLANIKVEVAKAEAAATQAQSSETSSDYNAKLSRSYAIGGSGIREGEDTDNAMYYYEQAKKTDIGQIRSEVAELNSNLSSLEYDDISASDNILNIDNLKWEDGKYIETNATIINWENRCVSEPIPIKNERTYTISKDDDSFFRVAGYDVNDNAVSLKVTENTAAKTFTCESTVKYLRIGVPDVSAIAKTLDFKIAVGSSVTTNPFIYSNKQLTDEVTQVNDSLDEQGLLNKFEPNNLQRGYWNDSCLFVSGTGNVSPKTPYICKDGDLITVKLTSSQPIVYLKFFNSSDTLLKKVSLNNVSCINEYAPSGAVKFVFTYDTSSGTETIENMKYKGVYYNNAIDELKNDLGGLSFSVSGTTLSITDGTNTWTLEAN